MSLRKRSYQKEFLDEVDLPKEDLQVNLNELNIINSRLGGYSASVRGLLNILKHFRPVRTILDIGCGGGNFIKHLHYFSSSRDNPLFFYGVDIKQDCVDYAREILKDIPDKQLICADYKNLDSELLNKIDVIHCSLFLHHLTDEEILALLNHAAKNHCILLANDLHRHRIALFSISALTAIFSRSKLVKNDAPLSVRRGFKKKSCRIFLPKVISAVILCNGAGRSDIL